MGCGTSRQRRCRQCNAPYSPVQRCYSVNVHHPAERRGDGYHVVALKSSTLGTLKIDTNKKKNHIDGGCGVVGNGNRHEGNSKINGDVQDPDEKRKGLPAEVIEAKVWSKMIEEKIPKVVPKTPVRTPPGEPETINAWELMEGLEDVSPLRSPNHLRCFSFDVVRSPSPVPCHHEKSKNPESGKVSPTPMWLQMGDDDQNYSSPEFDPEVIASFKESLQELSPENPFHLRQLPPENEKVHKINGFQSDRKGGRKTVIFYFTSLRGIRKTYEDCCHVRMILKGLGIRVDERDVSMHSGFKEELKELMGDGFRAGLPRVFVGNKYIGGAEEIQRLHEEGQLEKLLEGCETVDDGDRGSGGACEACGDIRFVPCETCSGSCKVFYEGDEEEEQEDEGEYGFQRCPDCNENGLIRCPVCCY
ncbi:hypothetical protein SLEP1_g20304 [Rubroshorea leprosula]|uniref:Glutaredoxin domain-containing protein n=1 Tax=Rubroshorea leprosula TaxID=152421 RepID=A0AAV5J285_9ROSI|nr:hypothetical protein SLEP1_g20304 [Rubroshorea leprosula]